MVAQEILLSTKPFSARARQPMRRAKRRLPACRTAPTSDARGTSSASSAGVRRASRLPAPAAGALRSSRARTRERGRPARARDRLSGSAISGTSSGARPSRTTRVKCASAAARRRLRASARRSSGRARASPRADPPRAAAPPAARAGTTRSSSSSEMRIVLPNCSSGDAASGMLLPSDELIFSPSHERRSGIVSTTWGSRPYASMTSLPGEEVVELVRASELDVGLHGDGVVGLHQAGTAARRPRSAAPRRNDRRSRRARASARRS